MLTMARLGTNDFPRAKLFYDAIAEILGAARVSEYDTAAGYKGASGGMFMVGKPRDGEATFGNGSQLGLEAPSRAAVDAAHAKAIELGGTCEGEPGPRGPAERNMYAAYFRDPDGNKIMVMKMGAD